MKQLSSPSQVDSVKVRAVACCTEQRSGLPDFPHLLFAPLALHLSHSHGLQGSDTISFCTRPLCWLFQNSYALIPPPFSPWRQHRGLLSVSPLCLEAEDTVNFFSCLEGQTPSHHQEHSSLWCVFQAQLLIWVSRAGLQCLTSAQRLEGLD